MWISKKKLDELIEDAVSDAEFEIWLKQSRENKETEQEKRLANLETQVSELEVTARILELNQAAAKREVREPKHVCKCGR